MRKTGFQEIPLKELIKAEWNYKQDDTELLAKLIKNIERNGQIENIIVREIKDNVFEVVNGNHRYDALQYLGVKKVVCYNLGDIPLEDAKRVAVETNETKFATDEIKLANLIVDLKGTFDFTDLAETMPFSEEWLTNVDNLLEFDWEGSEDELPEVDRGGDNEANKDTADSDKVVVVCDNHEEALAICDKLKGEGYECFVPERKKDETA